jgi:hypothetical protein
MRQGEQPHLGVGRHLRGLPRGAVQRQRGAVGLVVRERRLVDEHVGAMRRDDDGVGRRGVARDDDPAPGARLAHDLLGRHAGDRLPPLQAPEVGARRHAQPLRQLGVEATRPRVLEQRVAERGAAMAHGERDDLQVVAAHRLVGLEVADRQAVARAAVDRPQALEQRGRAGRPVDGERLLAVAQLEGLQHARQPEPVVGVQVGEKDVGQVGEPDGAHELALRALAAVDEDALAAAPHEQRRKPAPRRRNGARGAREEERQIHGARVLRADRVALEPVPRRPPCSRSFASSSCAATWSTWRWRW